MEMKLRGKAYSLINLANAVIVFFSSMMRLYISLDKSIHQMNRWNYIIQVMPGMMKGTLK